MSPGWQLWAAEYTIKASAILLAAWLVTLILRRAPAATRHFVLTAGFVAVLLLPALEIVVPRHAVEILPATPTPVSLAQVSPAATQGLRPRTPTADILDATDQFTQVAPAATQGLRPRTPIADTLAAADQVTQVAPAATQGLRPRAPTAEMLSVAWMLGVGVITLNVLIAFLVVRRIRTARESLPRDETERIANQIGLRRPWQLRFSATERPPVAMTWGVARPVVLMPRDSRSWPQARLEAVLLHELAHVRRFDGLSQLISVAVCALNWFNPIAWLCARALRAEAELAADDCVLRSGVKPSSYAAILLQVAVELGRRRQPFTPAGVSLMKQSKIESRVHAILAKTPRRRGMALLEALATLALVVVAAGAVASLHAAPQVVSGDKKPAKVAAVKSHHSASPTKHARQAHLKLERARLKMLRARIDHQTRRLVLEQLKLAKAQAALESADIRAAAKQADQYKRLKSSRDALIKARLDEYRAKGASADVRLRQETVDAMKAELAQTSADQAKRGAIAEASVKLDRAKALQDEIALAKGADQRVSQDASAQAEKKRALADVLAAEGQAGKATADRLDAVKAQQAQLQDDIDQKVELKYQLAADKRQADANRKQDVVRLVDGMKGLFKARNTQVHLTKQQRIKMLQAEYAAAQDRLRRIEKRLKDAQGGRQPSSSKLSD